MDAELRPIRPESVPRALLKAERYRLLGEPREVESICRDVLAADEGNQGALAMMTFEHTHGYFPYSRTGSLWRALPYVEQVTLAEKFEASGLKSWYQDERAKVVS